MKEYYCPLCKSVLEVGTASMSTEDFTAIVHYAVCKALIDDDPNWGGGVDCEFIIVRETPAKLNEELERTCKNSH